MNWIHHNKNLTDCGEVVTNVDSPNLQSALNTLLQRHLEPFDTDYSGSSTQDNGLNSHSISAALDHCKKSYKMVENISINQTDSGMVMALITNDCS